MAYIPRSLEAVVARAAGEFPAVILLGPRQAGKTTLLKALYGGKMPLLSFDLPEVRTAARDDPQGFLDFYPPPVIFDEIQYAPGLLPYIKQRIDARRDAPGQYLLTGSQNLLLMQQATESLAGRAAVLKLLPLAQREVAGEPLRPPAWEAAPLREGAASPDAAETWQVILRGAYPEVTADPDRDFRLWQGSYIQTYLERDVRSLRNLGDLTLFQTFLRALAARAAQLLNASEIARDVGVSVNTVKAWLAILEATFQIFLLRPYYANLGKRLVKSPKVYFVDSGLLCYLVGLRDAAHAAAGPMGGALFENLAAAEIYKGFIHRGEAPAFYFWRTASGEEVDFLIETKAGLIPLEAKASATARVEMAQGIASLRRSLGARVQKGYVLYLGKAIQPLSADALALPWGRV
ncbi:MAG: ATP-binding protein [Chloroflexi bacterium]|nr:ATP-binding protein [Chloroflexota bacterium]